jgi:hypothetical protein
MTTISQTIPSLGSPPLTTDPVNFDTRADTLYGTSLPAVITATNTWSGQANTVAGEVNTNATNAQASANTASGASAAAVAAVNATQWVSGQSYLTGAVVWSPINYLSYRANTNTSGTTDPSASADWTSLNLSLSAANTWTGKQTFSGTTSTLAVVLNDAAEVATVSATAATGTIAYDITTQSVLYYTSNASANWTVNFRASSGTSLDTALTTGQSVTAAFLVTQGATAYYNSAVQVDGTTSGITTRWLGGAPTAGNASGIDSYRYLIIKTGSAAYTVLASVTQFKA